MSKTRTPPLCWPERRSRPLAFIAASRSFAFGANPAPCLYPATTRWSRKHSGLYAASLQETGSAFGIEKADELKVRIETACILEDWECPPAEQAFLFPIPNKPTTEASPATARK
jgi:hypothetical protein